MLEIIMPIMESNPRMFLAYCFKKAGYLHGDGIMKNYLDHAGHFMVYKYYPGKKDILFKRFQRWKPDWEIKKERACPIRRSPKCWNWRINNDR